MTFEQWFEKNYTDIAGVDRNTAARLRDAARQAFKNCWNAALDEAKEHSYPTNQLISNRAVAVDELDDLRV